MVNWQVLILCNKLFSCIHLVESLAAQEKDTGGVCFVSAFQGLFAPYWNAEARGCVYLLCTSVVSSLA